MLFHLLLNHYWRKMFDIPPPTVRLFSLRVLLLAGGSLLMENKKGFSSALLQHPQFPVAHDPDLNTITRKHHPNIYYRLQDRKSTRLNSSHVAISYAVFCLKKKK